MVREVRNDDLQKLLELYLYLHEDSVPEMSKHLKDVWSSILED